MTEGISHLSRESAALIHHLPFPLATSDDGGLTARSFAELLAREEAHTLAACLDAHPHARAFLIAVAAEAPYLRDLMLQDPARLLRVLTQPPQARLDALFDAIRLPHSDEPALKRHLRHIKQEAALIIALADLARLFPLEKVTGNLSRLADAATSAVLRFLLREAAARGHIALACPEDPERDSGFIVLGLGKLGARELNYSSDIDLIILFDATRVCLPQESDPTTFFVRLTRRLIALLQERTAEGYVFRVDLRLRPDPGATPLALSTLSALQYYEGLGQNWERAALIKARPIAGDLTAGARFLDELKPFIWRKYLDYVALGDIHAIKRQIEAHHGHGAITVPGHNVKLGQGGIREIEFFVQTQQLIAGGRNPDLRGRETLAMLSALCMHGWLKEEARAELASAYDFLRRIEHRLQMILDEQTHSLPEDGEGLARVARLMGFREQAAFSERLLLHLKTVRRHYAALFREERSSEADVIPALAFTGEGEDPETLHALHALGYRQPDVVAATVKAWRSGRYPATRSPRALALLTGITPRLLTALAQGAQADQALASFDFLLSKMPAGMQFFSLLNENAPLLNLLALLLGTAPRLADIIARRPHVVDALIEPTLPGGVPSKEDLTARLATSLRESRSFEETLDRARRFGQEHMFVIGARFIAGILEAREAARGFSDLADCLVHGLLDASLAEIEKAHGPMPGGRVALLALGRLGAREMTATSDLDLILLYDHPAEVTLSTGQKPLAPSHYYARLTQRLVTALAAPTAEGSLYPVDFRLRPSGNAGPLATALAAFTRYQEEEAWTWEHLALTRARAIAGTPSLREEAHQLIAHILMKPRDALRIREDVAVMRGRIEAEKGTNDPFMVKTVPGGFLDIEFIAATLQLLESGAHPSLLTGNTEGALLAAQAEKLIPHEESEALLDAYRLYREVHALLSLAVSGPFHPEKAPGGIAKLLCRAGKVETLAALEERLRMHQTKVRAIFTAKVGPVDAATAGSTTLS